MAENQTLVVLRNKREEIERAIANYEKKLDMARRDLTHVIATISMFEAADERTQFPVYVDTLRLFRRREIVTLCKQALAKNGPMTTRELAVYVMREKGLDEGDHVLRKSITYRTSQALRLKWKEGKVDSPEKRGNVRLWQLPGPA